MNIEQIQTLLQRVADERDWNKFHTPKNLAMALNVEASELMEIFQWQTGEESLAIKNSDKINKVKDEVADVAIYLLRLCDILKIDLEDAINQKMEKNLQKYPVDKAKGNAKKYTEL